jgi:predicted dehydrogenase
VIHLNSPHPTLAPDLVQIKQWMAQYDLGRVVGVRADTWAPYFEEADGSWYDDPKQAPGAPIFRLGIYLLNDIIQLIGMPDLVYLVQSRIRTGRPTSDNAQLTLRFPNGCVGNLYVSLCVGDGELRKMALTINFERGTIYRNVGPTETPGSRDLVQLQISAIPEGRERILERAEVPGGSGTYNWDLFHRAVCGEKLENEVTPEEIVAGLRVVKAMAHSEVSGLPELVERQPAMA